ncbi:hypothetical protein N7541_008838 [Penicillium brevicompactum]|uniref:Uncharacterized protein n=1 Tax=Penicillium brevicompactum TaxID=5074 RepID=A0A9W9QVD7_PENBR|nr:hypothetical protein N7541_008838 [Penicillium brevicompactum]
MGPNYVGHRPSRIPNRLLPLEVEELILFTFPWNLIDTLLFFTSHLHFEDRFAFSIPLLNPSRKYILGALIFSTLLQGIS